MFPLFALACAPERPPPLDAPAAAAPLWEWDPGGGRIVHASPSRIDVDLDGFDDILVERAGNELVIWHGAADATGSWVETTSLPLGAEAIGDVDGDGVGDLARPYRGSDGAPPGADFYRGTGVGFEPLPTLAPSLDPAFVNAGVVPVGDTDGDGREDILVVGSPDTFNDYANWDVEAWAYRYTDAGWVPGAHWSQPAAGWWGFTAAGDVNGDGYADLLAALAGEVRVYPGGPDGLGNTTIVSWSTEVQAMAAAGDVNGDGYADLLIEPWAEPTRDGVVELHLGGPAGPSEEPDLVLDALVGATNSLGAFSWPADHDGDGWADIVLSTYALPDSPDGGIFLYRGGAEGPAADPDTSWIVEGGLHRSVMVGDVNGDGRDDRLVNDTVWLGG
jgi:hypothetical protein